MVLFLNDHEPAMNVLAFNRQEVKDWIEAEFDTSFEDVENIEDVTALHEWDNDDGLVTLDDNTDWSLFPVEFTDLTGKIPLTKEQREYINREHNITIQEFAEYYGHGYPSAAAFEKMKEEEEV